MVSTVIEILNARLQLTGFFHSLYCLVEKKRERREEGDHVYPAQYVGGGDLQMIEFDSAGFAYFRKDGEITQSIVENDFGQSQWYEVTIPLKLVAMVNRSDVNGDDSFSPDALARQLASSLTFRNGDLRTALTAAKTQVNAANWITDPEQIWSDETEGTGALEPDYRRAFIAMSVTVSVTADERCIQNLCEADTDILHIFDFCKATTVARLTDAQRVCLEAAICPTPEDAKWELYNTEGTLLSTGSIPSGDTDSIVAPDATVLINGNQFDTVASGDAVDLPVVNGGSNPVGSEQSGEWVVGNSAVTINGTQVGDVVAEDSLPIAVELDGNPSGVWNAGTQTWEVTGAPCADATFSIDGIQVDTVASGADLDVSVELNGSPVTPTYDSLTKIIGVTSGPSGSVSVAVSNATTSTGQTITITATAIGFAPTNHIFFTFDGSTIEFIAEQASGVYNWLVDRVGTYDIYVLATDGALEIYGTIGVVAASGYVLDLITPQPVWAISLRRLRSGYTGAACIVRRSSDNTTLAIGFIGEDLDAASLTGFVGVNNGFSATMYNQMLTGSNAEQVTAGSQPAIVVSGTIQLLGGKPTIVFNGTSSQMEMTSTITFSHCLVVARKSANVNPAQAVIGGGGATAFYFGGTLGGGYNSICVDTPAGSLFSGINNTSPHQSSLRLGGAGSGRIRVDGITTVTGTTSASMTVSRVGARSDISVRHVGDISEIILYSSVLSDANELIIENNQRAYYGL